jgi:hypothetical protein
VYERSKIDVKDKRALLEALSDWQTALAGDDRFIY